MSEQEKKANELLESVDVSRRAMLKRILLSMPAAYIAPAVATFSLHSAFSPATAHAMGSNQPLACHPLGGNQAVLFPATPGHQLHGDKIVFGGSPGESCDP